MSYETSIEDIINGDRLARELSKKLNIPHRYTACRRDLIDEVQGKVEGELYPIDIFIKLPWN
jgi:hypothetical protein